jgi:hypothetical protein
VQFLLHYGARMNTYLPNGDISKTALSRKTAEGMLRAVDRNYERLLAAAKKEWESDYAGPEPSDACVRVRIGVGQPQALSSVSKSY